MALRELRLAWANFLFILLTSPVLLIVGFPIDFALLHKGLMVSHIRDMAIVHDYYQVGILNGGYALGNDYLGSLRYIGPEAGADEGCPLYF